MIYAFSFEGTNGVPTPFSIGLPLPQGKFWPEQNLAVVTNDKNTQNNYELVASVTPTSLWADKSIRWCQIEGYTTHTSAQKAFLVERASILVQKHDCASEKPDKFVLKSRDLSLDISKKSFLSVQQNTEKGSSAFDINPLFAANESHSPFSLINSVFFTKTSSCNKPIYASLKQEYRTHIGNNQKAINVKVEYKLDYPTNHLKVTLAAHNPMPLVQTNGQWDLGNENSIELHKFGLRLALSNSQFLVAKVHEDEEVAPLKFKKFDEWNIAINNSGGDNWLSKNHVDKHGLVAQTERGSIVTENVGGNTSTYAEMRPSFLFKLNDATQQLVLNIDHLWQKFPLDISANKHKILVNFCGASTLSPIEIQPGEIKFHSFDICLTAASNNTNAQVQPMKNMAITLNTEAYSQANAIAWLSESAQHSSLQKIIDLGLSGKRNFFAKREALDEFGWRNFGDIYADHEAVGHTGKDIFVSHYNNQYDPLQSFLKQWLISGNPQWKVLADNLFEHIVNIDIYHTDLDKQEYNGGLFWHTDHYVEAETATHRTYSKRQKTGVYEDHAGGGGPGSHHCYSSGLALYYQLSGEETAKHAVLKLANWITNFFEGDGTLVGTLLNYRNKAIVRNPLTGRYPLDRGVGNYLNVLLDSYELTADRQYITRVSSIIRHTFHHSDDITQRKFDDIENTWYYIVFMQSVAKYLWMCETLCGVDQDYATIKKSFLHYVNWIVKHEQPYLFNKHKLEYPNDTWTAQDLRKIMVLTIALKYVTDEEKLSIKQKIDSLKQYVEPKLLNSNEKDSARILALVMQNAIGDSSDANSNYSNYNTAQNATVEQATSPYSLTSVAYRFIRNYSLSREFRHFFIRFPQLKPAIKAEPKRSK